MKNMSGILNRCVFVKKVKKNDKARDISKKPDVGHSMVSAYSLRGYKYK